MVTHVLPLAHLTLLECPLRSIDTTQIMMIVRLCCSLAFFINHFAVYGDDVGEDPPHGYPGPDLVSDLEAEILNLSPDMQKYLPSLERKIRKADVVSDTDEENRDIPALDISPRANLKPKPDSVSNLEAEFRTLSPDMQRYLKNLERRTRKADVVSDTDEENGDIPAPDISPRANRKPKPDSVLDLEVEIRNLQKHLRSQKARKADVVSDTDEENPAPDISPRANHKPKPDSILDLEAQIRIHQKRLRSLKARKADVVSDTNEFLPSSLAKMDLNGPNRSSPAPFTSRNRDIPSARKRYADYFASNASYATRSHASDYEPTTSDEETPPDFRMKNIDSNNMTTEYVSDYDNNNFTYIETTREVKGLSISSQFRFYLFTDF